MDATRRKTIHEAMVRLADGDRTAFDLLLDQLWPVVLSFAQRGVGWGPDAEDVAQEVFLRICARISDFDRSRDGLSWAFGIASHEIMSHRRRVQRRREVHDEPSLAVRAAEVDSQEHALLSRELKLVLEQAVGALTDDDRRALGLLPATDTVGLPGATLRKRKQRALDRLRDLWRGIYGES
jgi:RNA polymerase sigma-70 factor (ECF subfamily)